MITSIFLVINLLVKFSTTFDNSNKQHPIRVIDIFTNYPNTEEILKDYNLIQRKRYHVFTEPLNMTSRGYRDYDEYYNPYRKHSNHYENNYYDTDRKYNTGPGDVLESEFGVFDRNKNNYADRYHDKYIYVQGQKYSDYVPSHSHKHYTINKPYTSDDNADNFKDKLNQFITEVEKRPNFYTRKNSTRYDIYTKPSLYDNYADQFNFKPISDQHPTITVNKFPPTINEEDTETNTDDADDDAMQSEYGEIVPKPTKPPKRKPIVKKPNKKKKKPQQTAQKPNDDVILITGSTLQQQEIEPETQNVTRERLTNLLRKYLIKMHRKKDGSEQERDYPKKEKIASIFGNFGNIANILDDPKTQIITDYKIDEGKQKFLTNPLESIKNKTMKFANKFLSLFTVIQFANFKCQATSTFSNYEGTCFLASECVALRGSAMGNCADGHGVCCVFRGTCGGIGSNNCTYFESPGYPNYFPETGGVVTPSPTSSTMNPLTPDPRQPILLYVEGRQSTDMTAANALSCIFRVYKTNNSIKQMRIDFVDLELNGPTNGVCTNERLVISGVGISTMIPILCGYNTGQHIYVDVSNLSGPLQLAVLANTIDRKRYKLKICQYDDGCSGLMNCLQYYTGITGTITSFNYEQAASFSRSTPQYLNSLNYAICIKRAPGYCTITYTVVGPNNVQYPFELRNLDFVGLPTVPNGQAGVGVINCPDDYIVINGIRLCGQRLNDGSVIPNFTQNAPVTDTSGGPIIIPVRTSSTTNGRGFKLFYTQNRCTTSTTIPGGGVPDPRQRSLD